MHIHSKTSKGIFYGLVLATVVSIVVGANFTEPHEAFFSWLNETVDDTANFFKEILPF